VQEGIVNARWLSALLLGALLAFGGAARAQEEAEAAREAPLGEEEAMVLNFERADIREVIHSLASALGISYTIDPRIEGQITIRTTGKISRDDLFPLLNQILRNNGIAAVRVGEIYQILPVAEAKTRAILPKEPGEKREARENDSFVIEIIPVKHVSADEMVNILQPFVTPGGDALSYPRSNLVVVTDLESNVERLRDLVDTFDSDVFRDLRTRVFKIEHGDPEELANEILGLLAPYGVAPGADGEGAGVFVVPLSRLNSLVVVAFDPAIFSEIERWLKLLDIPPEEGAGRQTFVYNVENAKAVDLAEVLNELFGGGPGGGGGFGGRAAGAPPAGVGLFGAGGVSGGRGGRGLGGGAGRGGLGGGGGGAGQQGAAFGQQAGGGIGGAGGAGTGARGGRLGRGGAAGGAVGIGGAAGAAGGAAAGAAGARGVSLPGRAGTTPGAPGQPQGPPPVFKEEVRIVADEVTNSLVVLATKRDYQLIVDVLRRLDVVPRQVLLEVMIAEITLGDDFNFGVAYAISADKRLSSSLPQGNPNADIFAVGAPGPNGMGARGLTGLFPSTPRVPLAGAFAVLSNRDNVNVFLSALAARTNVKMLSAPHIIAADNREAHILVGDSIPILTSTGAANVATGVSGNLLSVNQVQYRDTGKILTILPQVNSKGLVNLQIRQEVSAVGQESFGTTNSPSFSTREAETTAVVHDGETVLIGGIIDDSITHSRRGLPFLMDIPVIGVAFRTETDRKTRTELLILISPYVIRNRDDAREVTQEFADQVDGLRRMGRMVRQRHERLKRRASERSAQQADPEPIPMPPVRSGTTSSPPPR
jgi:general secretion pathway protein D